MIIGDERSVFSRCEDVKDFFKARSFAAQLNLLLEIMVWWHVSR